MPLKTLAEVPTNIALIKYWGKEDAGKQWPANSSLSMTLKSSKTKTSIEESRDGKTRFYLQNKEQHHEKLVQFIDFLSQECGLQKKISVISENTFPASCGIASSASGYACLTLACCAYATQATTWNDLERAGFSRERLADLARLGSGSACRSLFGGFVKWNKNQTPEQQNIEKVLSPLALSDTIVVISAEEKTISSSEGHKRAWSSPLFAKRLTHVSERLSALKAFLAEGNFAEAGVLVEEDAEEMHEVMESGNPPAHYRTAATLQVLAWVKRKRAEGLMAFATVDAGPNVHILTQEKDQKKLIDKIGLDFPNYSVISDVMGSDDDIAFRQVMP